MELTNTEHPNPLSNPSLHEDYEVYQPPKKSAKFNPTPTSSLVHFNQDQASQLLYTKNALGRYIIIHKQISALFIQIHTLLFCLVFIKLLSSGIMISESETCLVTWPLMHIIYMSLNGFMAWWFAMNFIEASNLDNEPLNHNKKIIYQLICFCFAFVGLKCLSDSVCQVLRVSTVDLMAVIFQVILECVYLKLFYDWYIYKVSVYKFTMIQNVEHM